MRKRTLMVLIVSITGLLCVGCKGFANQSNVQQSESQMESQTESHSESQSESQLQSQPDHKQKEESSTEPTTSQSAVEPGIINTDFKPGFILASDEYIPLDIKANAPEYSINSDLSNIENVDQFSNLTQKQRDMIAQNGFVVRPTDSEQLFYIYEDNTYKKVPGFVTTDSVLQLYHIFFDYSLRNLETDFFYQDLVSLNENMIKQLLIEYNNTSNNGMKETISKMIGYFGVANLALEVPLPTEFPAELTTLVKQEYSLIEKAESRTESPLFGYKIDYSLFTIRGHYTRSEELGRYFRAMSWYGIVPMPFYSQDGKQRDEQSAMRAIAATIALCRLPEEEGVKLWENIYSTTSFYVGESDDLTPFEIAEVISKVYSKTPDMNEIKDKLDEFYLELERVRQPEIEPSSRIAVTGLQMRFMGQRYIPDSEILQKLSHDIKRPIPTGVDVFAVFGSERAEELLDEIYKPNLQWNEYQKHFDILKNKFRKQTIQEQTSNQYNAWLYCLKSLTTRLEAGYPLFMRNTAWEDKSLSTALGSWAEIRHDTILYGKQSGTECGGGEEPPELMGYVEPNPEFYNRLYWLVVMTKYNLSSRDMLNSNMNHKLEDFEEMLLFLKTCSDKELNGEDLSMEEQYTILTYGGTLEYISSSIAEADNWFLVESDTDRNMAVIADVHTSGNVYLEEGVGTAAEIYVAIPQHGKIYLTRGAVFDFYEFTSEERLTDETWQDTIKQAPPQRPPFTNSFMDDESGVEVPAPAEPYSTGC